MDKFKVDQELIAKIDRILESYDYDDNSVVNILLEIQSHIPENYIPEEVAKYVGIELGIPTSKVYDVITFFSAINDKPKGRHVVQLCKSSVCRLNKYQTIRDVLEEELKIKMGETTKDGQFTLRYSACFGACDISPAFRIDDKVYGNLTKGKIKEIINTYRGL